MISYRTGDLFGEEVEALVNTVNCVGVMGRGIALQFKKKYPENYRAYASACKQGQVIPGKMFVYATGILITPKYIINFPTKRHWRERSRMDDIESGLNDLVTNIRKLQIRSIAIPPLGCGLGGLNWSEVKNRIEHALAELTDVEVLVFEPSGAPETKQLAKIHNVPKMTPGRAALIVLIQRYLAGLLDPFVTLLEVHKLMYFLQESGEQLRLDYQKHIYGPYATNLRHVLNTVEGHYLTGYADGGDTPEKELKLVPGAHEKAAMFLSEHQQTKLHYSKVSDLVEGFESPFGMELLSTVHWVATKQNADTVEHIIQQVHQWNEHKRQFTPRQIELAYHVLRDKGWLDSSACR